MFIKVEYFDLLNLLTANGSRLFKIKQTEEYCDGAALRTMDAYFRCLVYICVLTRSNLFPVEVDTERTSRRLLVIMMMLMMMMMVLVKGTTFVNYMFGESIRQIQLIKFK